MNEYQKFKETREKMFETLDVMKEAGLKSAEAEVNYRIAYAKKLLLLKEQGVPATLCKEIIFSDEQVSGALLERLIAEVLYHNAQEAVNVYKKESTFIENDLKTTAY